MISMKFLMTTFATIGIIAMSQAQVTRDYTLQVINDTDPLKSAVVTLMPMDQVFVTDSMGKIQFKVQDNALIEVIIDDVDQVFKVQLDTLMQTNIHINILKANQLEDVVISGTMKAVSKLDSPVPVEVYSASFFKRNPSPSLFDGLQNINGVRPQVNCNVCNTGDIHINGLEGPYTMVLLDGMPIVSGLSTVYGLQGIPQSIIDRIEVVKGPASTLYGSEAVGGLINIITKNVDQLPLFSIDMHSNTWLEHNIDASYKQHWKGKASTMLGVNYFNYQQPRDDNGDNFTDLTLQNRIAVFNKWQFYRKSNKPFSFMARFLHENRWGGEMQWTPQYRGGTDIYGESIYTTRWEMIGTYALPTKADITLNVSYNHHEQNAVYGNMPYIADQKVAFLQLLHRHKIQQHELLMGATYRYTYYDDNTPATYDDVQISNAPTHTHLPGLFIQDEWTLDKQNTILLGARYDYNSIHGSIFSPRINYKWRNDAGTHVMRVSLGNGYRVVNVFTEDHAALTGSREVVFLEDLRPEQSWNANINWVQKIFPANESVITLDATAFYTYFTNKIIADYDTDPNLIIYENLNGHSLSKGISLNVDYMGYKGLKVLLGATLMDVYSVENEAKVRQLFTEKFTGTWSIAYTIQPWKLTLDYTGNVYSPMRLPILHEMDPRPEYSPWWSIQNIQATYKIKEHWEVYLGMKNLLNWTPSRSTDMLIARSFDPFDRGVDFNPDGQVIPTPSNPYALQFDPAYVYAANQGIRGFLGMRFQLR